MKLLFGVVGAIIGALFGEVVGALMGLAFGVTAGALMTRPSKAAVAAMPPPGNFKLEVATAEVLLEQRVHKLERDVAALRIEVQRLHGRLSDAALPTADLPATAAVPVAAATPPSADEITPSFFDADAPAAGPAIDAAAAIEPLPSEGSSELPLELPSTSTGSLPDLAAAQTSQAPFIDTAPLPLRDDAEALLPSTAATPAESAVPPPGAVPAPAATRPSVAAPRAKRPAAPPPRSLQERLPPVLGKLIFGGNTIVKVGVLILFLGLAFLLRYAAERVTVPVELRYAGVALFGAVMLGLGWRLRDRKDAAGGTGFGLVLQGAGIGVFYLTTLSALKLNHLLPPELAFAFLFLVAVLSAVLAVAQNAPWLAYVATAEGFAAPALVSTGGGNHIALFSYLAILDIGIFLIAWFKAWRPLNLVGFVGTFTLAGAWAQHHYTDAHYPSTQGFLLLFFVLFTAIGVLFARRALSEGSEPDLRDPLAQRAAQAITQVGRVDSSLVFGVPLASFSLQYLLVRHDEFGPAWAALGFALFYLLVGGALLRSGNRRYSLLGEAYVIVSVIFGTLSIPLALEGTWTGATWAVEAAGMYWLGMRQRRSYARAFAFLVLGGATLRLVSALTLDWQAATPLLQGSLLGMAMLSASALAMLWVNRRAQPEPDQAWEAAGAQASLWIGAAAFAAMPWMWLLPPWASVATSLLALACALLRSRTTLPTLTGVSTALHGVALVGFTATLHAEHDSAMLSSGWEGLAAAVLIGVSLLATCWISLRATLSAAAARGVAPTWSLGSSIGLLAGLAVVNGSLLFVMPANQAAGVWPWVGLLALWVGLRVAHPALGLAWAGLQAASAVALLIYGPALWTTQSKGLTFWMPLGLTAVGMFSGDWLQRAARQASPMPWVRSPLVQWGVVLWSLAWWTQVLPPEAYRVLAHMDNDAVYLYGPAVAAGWVLITSAVLALIARWRDWAVLGQTTAATLPAWVMAAWVGVGAARFAPHAYAGWLVWPLALVWHFCLLRWQPRWVKASWLQPLHVGGVWLFVLLAAREGQWWSAGWGDAASAWPMLGWVIVPALVLALLRQRRVLQAWPLTDFRNSYMVVAAMPIAAYLLLWVWVSNTQPGDATPLPYVPLLNPLELGQGLVLLALALWQRELPDWVRASEPRSFMRAGLGATAFALYTGMVLRTCHHWAGVEWSGDALFDSTLTQAALSVAWAIVGVTLMMAGHRYVKRAVWVVGASLLGVVVLKLFFVELADRGGLYRIVSFIVVGLLLLVVGYFAPVPPSQGQAADDTSPS